MAISVETLALAKSYTDTHGGTDEMLEYENSTYFPSTGRTKTLYVDTSTNLAYRWSGSTYVIVSPMLALGETSETAFRGDRGSTLYQKITGLEGSANNGKVVTIQNGVMSTTEVETLFPNGDTINY